MTKVNLTFHMEEQPGQGISMAGTTVETVSGNRVTSNTTSEYTSGNETVRLVATNDIVVNGGQRTEVTTSVQVREVHDPVADTTCVSRTTVETITTTPVDAAPVPSGEAASSSAVFGAPVETVSVPSASASSSSASSTSEASSEEPAPEAPISSSNIKVEDFQAKEKLEVNTTIDLGHDTEEKKDNEPISSSPERKKQKVN